MTFIQVFFNPDDRKGAAIEEAKAELVKLKAVGKPDPATLVAGGHWTLAVLLGGRVLS